MKLPTILFSVLGVVSAYIGADADSSDAGRISLAPPASPSTVPQFSAIPPWQVHSHHGRSPPSQTLSAPGTEESGEYVECMLPEGCSDSVSILPFPINPAPHLPPTDIVASIPLATSSKFMFIHPLLPSDGLGDEARIINRHSVIKPGPTTFVTSTVASRT